jgi:short-subunit dehydrogenase
MDILHSIGDFWVRRRAQPQAASLELVQDLAPATVITGASEGLGFALARRIARERRTIVLLARSLDVLEGAAGALAAEFPKSRVIAEVLDISEADAPAKLDTLLARHGVYLDVLVNNAAIGLGGEFAEVDQARLDELVATNVAALTRLTRYYLPPMLGRARGGIMNLASLASFVPGPWQAPYFASKAYVLSLTAAIGRECSGRGVRICAIAPGPFETRIHRKMRTSNTYYRLLLPSTSADRMARLAWRSYRIGRRVVVPGIVNGAFAWSARAMPYEILLPLVSWLMRPRARPIRGMAARMKAQERIDRAKSPRDFDAD